MVEKQPYRLIRSLGGGAELRHYPAHRVVSIDVRGGFDQAGNLGFGPLVGYISGANTASQKIAMTAPVVLEPDDTGQQTVSFVLPQSWWNSPAPTPSHPAVRIDDRPEVTVAALRFRGLWREQRVLEHTRVLREIVARAGLVESGAVLYARYDPPSMPGPLRRNEVMIPVAEATATTPQ